MSHNRTEWVIHIWGKKRDTLELNGVEKFHIDTHRLADIRELRNTRLSGAYKCAVKSYVF